MALTKTSAKWQLAKSNLGFYVKRLEDLVQYSGYASNDMDALGNFNNNALHEVEVVIDVVINDSMNDLVNIAGIVSAFYDVKINKVAPFALLQLCKFAHNLQSDLGLIDEYLVGCNQWESSDEFQQALSSHSGGSGNLLLFHEVQVLWLISNRKYHEIKQLYQRYLDNSNQGTTTKRSTHRHSGNKRSKVLFVGRYPNEARNGLLLDDIFTGTHDIDYVFLDGGYDDVSNGLPTNSSTFHNLLDIEITPIYQHVIMDIATWRHFILTKTPVSNRTQKVKRGEYYNHLPRQWLDSILKDGGTFTLCYRSGKYSPEVTRQRYGKYYDPFLRSNGYTLDDDKPNFIDYQPLLDMINDTYEGTFLAVAHKPVIQIFARNQKPATMADLKERPVLYLSYTKPTKAPTNTRRNSAITIVPQQPSTQFTSLQHQETRTRQFPIYQEAMQYESRIPQRTHLGSADRASRSHPRVSGKHRSIYTRKAHHTNSGPVKWVSPTSRPTKSNPKPPTHAQQDKRIIRRLVRKWSALDLRAILFYLNRLKLQHLPSNPHNQHSSSTPYVLHRAFDHAQIITLVAGKDPENNKHFDRLATCMMSGLVKKLHAPSLGEQFQITQPELRISIPYSTLVHFIHQEHKKLIQSYRWGQQRAALDRRIQQPFPPGRDWLE
jgi:hypothetical protein